MPRPLTYTPQTKIYVSSKAPSTKLQAASEPRAVVTAVLDLGGCPTIGDLNERFGYDTQPLVRRMISGGWLAVAA